MPKCRDCDNEAVHVDECSGLAFCKSCEESDYQEWFWNERAREYWLK